jgi:putative transposase
LAIAKSTNPFRWFDASPEVIRLAALMYVRFPLSLRNVEDLLFERGIDICHETVRLWWNRFGPMFALEVRRKRVQHVRAAALAAWSQSWPKRWLGLGSLRLPGDELPLV